MLYYFKKDKNTTEMQKKMCALYGEDAVTDQKYQKCFAKFCPRDTLLDDGRPVAVDSDQIETLIENTQLLYHLGDSQPTQNIQIEH